MLIRKRSNKFPNRLRECRLAARMTLTDLAEKIGVHEATISRHETGERGMTHHQVMQYAAVLGVDCEKIRSV